MSATLFRSAAARSTLRSLMARSSAIKPASAATIYTKATLPDLPYDYAALEPSISGRIMELHHKNHHQTYVNSYNAASEKLESAATPAEKIALQPLINFHGGGHINHSLFWENLAPAKAGGGGAPSGSLATAINEAYGGVDGLKKVVNAKLAGVQGSGWAWLVKDTENGGVVKVLALPNQDPVQGPYVPLLGIDAWEHAYYLQYQNRKAEYFNAIWDVVNWRKAEERFEKV